MVLILVENKGAYRCLTAWRAGHSQIMCNSSATATLERERERDYNALATAACAFQTSSFQIPSRHEQELLMFGKACSAAAAVRSAKLAALPSSLATCNT